MFFVSLQNINSLYCRHNQGSFSLSNSTQFVSIFKIWKSTCDNLQVWLPNVWCVYKGSQVNSWARRASLAFWPYETTNKWYWESSKVDVQNNINGQLSTHFKPGVMDCVLNLQRKTLKVTIAWAQKLVPMPTQDRKVTLWKNRSVTLEGTRRAACHIGPTCWTQTTRRSNCHNAM